MKQHPIGFAVAYAVLGAVVIATAVATFLILVTPVTPVAHKADINARLGAITVKELTKEAEKNIAAQASQSGVTLTSQKVVKVTHPDANSIDLYIKIKTVELGDMTLKVEFHKGIYSISGIEAV